MKVWTYPDHVLASVVSPIPDGRFRLAGPLVETVTNPDDADVIVVGIPLFLFRDRTALREKLPEFRKHEAKHAFLKVSDHEATFDSTAIMIQCNLREWMLASDRRSISCAWPVEDLGDCAAIPGGGFVRDVGFQGWLWHDCRKRAFESVRAEFGDRADLCGYPDFFGYLDQRGPEALRRKAEHRRSLRECRLQLCPQQIDGVFPYRFFEALSAARVPVLFSTGYVLPNAADVPWREIAFLFPAEAAPNAGPLIRGILRETPDEALVEMGRRGREFWLRWMDSRRWPEIHAEMTAATLRSEVKLP